MNAQQLLEGLKLTEQSDSAWVTKLIMLGPVAGVNGGCHGWLYKAAKALFYYRYRHGFTEDDIFTLLRAKANGYGRPVADSEIEDTIARTIRHAAGPDYNSGAIRQPKWPAPDFQRIDEIVRTGLGVKELTEVSPVNLTCNPVTSNQVVSCLFPGDPLICAGEDKPIVVTKPLSRWLNGEALLNQKLSQQSFIVPNPMTTVKGLNQDGKLSSRCLDNTGPREYLVIECDILKFSRDGKTPTPWKPWVELWEERGVTVADASAAILRHLNQFAPLVLAVRSGGKSIHGWFPCRGVAEETLHLFMKYAVMLGADHATWTRCQLVRMPGGTRENGKRQQVLYWNPEALKDSMGWQYERSRK